MEIVVLFASLKYFFVEGGEQFIIGLQTSRKIGLKLTIKITIIGLSIAVILFFLFFYSRVFVPTNLLELMLGMTLYYFSFRMFKETIKEESDDEYEADHKGYRYGYIYLVSLESIENSTALAALTFVDRSGALVGVIISVSLFIVLAIKIKSLLGKIPIDKLKLVSGSLLALTATPLIVYSLGLPASQWMHWIIPPQG